MSVTTQKYVRKPFEVDAVQVTAENISAVADWCLGEVIEENGARFIKVKVPRVLNDRQTKAFVGDWVLHAGGGFKVYMSKAFNQSFDKTGNPPKQMATTSEKLKQVATTVHEKVNPAVLPPSEPKVVASEFVEPVAVSETEPAGVTVISTNAPDPTEKADPYRRQPAVKTGLV